jgi:acetyl esterase/lipase
VRLIALVFAAFFFSLSLLTVVKAPTMLGWKLALLAGEFGYIFCFFSVILFLAQAHGAFFNPANTSRSLARATAGLSALAALLFAGPLLRAWWIARELPSRWQANFGTTPSEPFFQWRDFLRIRVSPTIEPTTFQIPSANGSLALDFYPAKINSGKRAPCVVVIHGGGWNNGDRTQLASLNSWLASRGFSVAAIDYRLVPTALWPAPREDTEVALHWLQAHTNELHLAPNQFVLLGRSAGGQIALATAYGKEKAAWRGVISLYGPADLNFAYEYGDENDVLHSLALLRAFLGGTPQQAPAKYLDASPYSYVDSDDPPTLLIHGKLDTLVWHKQSERLNAKLAQAGVHHIFISLPWATHAFDVNLNGPSGQLTRHAIDTFLRTVLESDRVSTSQK